MDTIEDAVRSLRQGRFVLLHDGKDRENEVDMLIAAQFIRPEHVAIMRKDAGGLICLALSYEVASKLGLLYMHDILSIAAKNSNTLSRMIYSYTPYGDKPSFSITVNHKDTYTGITDKDRALTIAEMANIAAKVINGNSNEGIAEFVSSFRSPGHVPLLIAAKGLLYERRGHTEMAIRLAEMAGLVPAVAICEMLDSSTYNALSVDKACNYARENGLCIIEGSTLYNYENDKRKYDNINKRN